LNFSLFENKKAEERGFVCFVVILLHTLADSHRKRNEKKTKGK